ncbi:hypothetical protein GCM10010915_22580 [Microbacterium faecale]|uniref:Uncharacterized protein n=1 Tax=Microbacterium faecale TaxID=1804630 RepID=A0A917DJ27_9MICO|nr:hypothetical protein GCM10010915_22580 [Microbacterium faecale]
MPTTPVIVRLPNSMMPWIPSSAVGTSESGVHIGHSEHPSPDPVNRTAPPVAMISTSATNDNQAKILSAGEIGMERLLYLP